MKLLVLAFFAVLAISAYAENQRDWSEIDWSKVVPVTELPGFWEGREIKPALHPKDSKRSGRIVGGQVVVPHSHPYQAGLLMDFGTGTGLCGGSLISASVILTAARCLVGSVFTEVIMGAHFLRSSEPSQQRRTVQSAQYLVHPQYNQLNFNNDIATLIILSPFELNQYVQTIPRAGNDGIGGGDFTGASTLTSGWGVVETGDTSANLRSVENTVISNAVCSQAFGVMIIPSTICISTSGGRGTCGGDSGGPLTTVVEGVRALIGVSSFVAPVGCSQGLPAGFARVTSFNEWINENMS